MTSRRTLLLRTAAATAGATGLVLGSSAFTQVEAARELSIGIDSDDDALLAIEPNDDLSANAAEIGDDGEFTIDLDGANVNGALSVGRIDDLRDPAVVETEAFTIRTRTDATVDLTVSLGETAGDSDVTVLIATQPGEADATFTIEEGGGIDEDNPVTLDPDAADEDPPGDRVFGAIAVQSANDATELEVELSLTAEIVEGDPD